MRIPRDRYLDQLIRRKGNGMIKIVSGIRRCGKSFLLFELFHDHLKSEGVGDEHLIEIALDDRRNLRLRNPDVILDYLTARIKNSGQYYVLLDEVQYLPEFEDVLNSLLHIRNVDVYVTGSNSKFLSSDIRTEFRGRGDDVQIHPLSLSEIVGGCPDKSFEEIWQDYIMYGGLPQLLSIETSEDKEAYLKQLFEVVYLSDLEERHRIQNPTEFDELINVLASAVGSLTNPSKIAKSIQSIKHKSISDATIHRYITFLEDAFLVKKAVRYDIKGRRYINALAKYYYEDIGLRNARLNFRQIEENHLMENILYNELCIRGYKVDVGIVEKYGKDAQGKTTKSTYEVDFVATKGSECYYLQSAYRMGSIEKEDQERFSLTQIPDSFKKIIVVKDNIHPRRDDYGILTIGLREFLLDSNSLKI